MKLKYKLILMFILIIVAASLPLSLFILNKQEKEKISLIIHQGEINSTILARSILNILLMNGGDIPASQIDSKEMIYSLKPLTENGLVYADAILISKHKKYNGIILADYINLHIVKRDIHTNTRLSSEEVDILKKQSKYKEVIIPGIPGFCYEFVSTVSLSGKAPLCIGRLIFSESIILKPIKKLRQIIYMATLIAILIATLLGLLFSRFISKPISYLTVAAERIESGAFNNQMPVKTKDELGQLLLTFNHMSQIINFKIDELVAANQKLSRLDRLKDEFLANISHELRTPLYGMIGLAESLIEGAAGKISNDAIHDLSLIVMSGKRLSNLVNDILDFSKLKHSDIDLQESPVNIYALTQLIISITGPMIGKKSLKVKNEISPEISFVYADENRLQQIMLNLVGNAVKFTEQGEIVISSQVYDKDAGRVVISVSDTGIGIPPDMLDRIFESFEQIDGSTARSYGGTGLGLAITRELVELHGGEIWVESKVGRGSKFFFTLKKYDSLVETDTQEKTLAIYTDMPTDDIRAVNMKRGEHKGRIMVVDDEPVNLQVLLNHLSLEGYLVEIFMSGLEALQRLEDGDLPDLILLDVMLPKLSGYDVCSIIRRKHSQHELPILMLTAKNKTDDIVVGLNAGANDYLTKPVNRHELLARVKALISLKNSVKEHNELNRIRLELDIAHEIQRTILPQNIPKFNNITIAVCYKPMNQLGGDFYDIQKICDDKIGVLLADVSGHGIPAAIICAMLEVAYSFHKEDTYEPSALFKRINMTMSNYTHGQYLTACYLYIDMKNKKLFHANAGHKPLLLWRRQENFLLKDQPTGKPIGLFQNEEYLTNEVDLKDGDRIILYTDGIVEARNSNREMFGEEKFYELIKEDKGSPADIFADYIIDVIEKWSGLSPGKSLDDDATLLVLDIGDKGDTSLATETQSTQRGKRDDGLRKGDEDKRGQHRSSM